MAKYRITYTNLDTGETTFEATFEVTDEAYASNWRRVTGIAPVVKNAEWTPAKSYGLAAYDLSQPAKELVPPNSPLRRGFDPGDEP